LLKPNDLVSGRIHTRSFALLLASLTIPVAMLFIGSNGTLGWAVTSASLSLLYSAWIQWSRHSNVTLLSLNLRKGR
jgi:hypothetical protein